MHSSLKKIRWAPLLRLVGCLAIGSVHGGTLDKIYSEALVSFQAGNFKKAAADLETVISNSSEGANLEPIYYTLGAAYFNLAQYPTTIETLNTYLSKFPKGPKVEEALFFTGQAQLKMHEYVKAEATLRQLENSPRYREQAMLLTAQVQKEEGNLEASTASLEKLTSGGIKTPLTANAALLLADAYSQKGDTSKTIAILKSLRDHLGLLDNILRPNAIAIEIGDRILSKNPQQALELYRLVQSREEILRIQKQSMADMQRQIDGNLMAVKENPSRILELETENATLRQTLEQNKILLSDFEKTPSFEIPLLLRMARAFTETGKKWEAIVIYDELLRRQAESADREPTLFSMIVSSADLNRYAKVEQYGQEYLKDFPKGTNTITVGYLMGSLAMQNGDPATAEKLFATIMEKHPGSNFREEMMIMMANGAFSQGRFADAAQSYKKFLAAYPKGSYSEEARYRSAVALVFAGNYEPAMKELESYIKDSPQGNFIADAKYRYAVCKYAASLNEEVVADTEAWQKEFGEQSPFSEVLSLKGDALAQLGRNEEATDAYLESYRGASSDAVMNYSLFETVKLLQKQAAWEKISSVFKEFINSHPDSPSVVAAAYWVARADTKLGKSEEAKRFLSAVIQNNINDPSRGAVEQLLTQLVQLCTKKKKPAYAASPSTMTNAPVATVTPSAPEVDSSVELASLLEKTGAESTPTARARLLFAKAELARLRKDQKEEEKNLAEMSTIFRPNDLSEMLLARAGDYLVSKGKWDQAEIYYTKLLDDFPKSDFLEFAYNGLGEVAYGRKDYPTALNSFTDAIEKASASTKLKDATVGQAKTLLAMGRLSDARKKFEEIASTREWRGESTAFSVYCLGKIEEKEGKLPEAIAYYQRVFVAYKRFLPWVAKAYIRSAECFEFLGKNEEALKTYQEMLRNEKQLSSFPEFEIARQKVEAAQTNPSPTPSSQ